MGPRDLLVRRVCRRGGIYLDANIENLAITQSVNQNEM